MSRDSEDDNEYVWLIERQGDTPYENAEQTGWTADPYKAHRYPTRAEADDQRRHRGYAAESVEHGFIPPYRSTSRDSVRARAEAALARIASLEKENDRLRAAVAEGDREIDVLRESIHPTMDGYCPVCGGGCLIGFATPRPARSALEASPVPEPTGMPTFCADHPDLWVPCPHDDHFPTPHTEETR